jgi:hypothetical protein
MQKATFGEVALWVMSEYPDHGVGSVFRVAAQTYSSCAFASWRL